MAIRTQAEVAKESAHLIRLRLVFLARNLIRAFGDKVHQGPFRGMTMLRNEEETISAFVPRLLGFYEQDLHPHVEAAIARGYGAVVNVGCAEGYYAVGLARRMPASRHYAFDIAAHAQQQCREAARLNEVADRVEIAGECDHAAIERIVASHDSTLVIIDCEGAESTILDPDACPALQRCDIIVECHDFIVPNVTELLTARFSSTHDIARVRQGPRDPANLDILRNVTDLDRWLVVIEERPKLMWWLIMTARRGQ